MGYTTESYLWQDICFYNNGIDDRIYVAFSPSNSQIFCYWSNDYGVSSAGSIEIDEDCYIDQLQLQSCGGTSNQNLAIAYRKQYVYNSPDWDFRGQFSISGGTTLNSFNASWIDYTIFRTKFVSMQSIGLSQGRYVFSWADSSNGINGTHKFMQTNDAGATFSTAPVISSAAGSGAISLGGTHAGYRLRRIS